MTYDLFIDSLKYILFIDGDATYSLIYS